MVSTLRPEAPPRNAMTPHPLEHRKVRPPVEQREVRKVLQRLGADLLILAGISGVLVWAWAMLEGSLYQHIQRTEFSRNLPVMPEPNTSNNNSSPVEALPRTIEALPRATRILPNAPKLADLFQRDPLLIGELNIPRVNLSVMVREGVEDVTLRRAVGHVPWSVFPGQPGNAVILGHRDTFFRPLRDVSRGDTVVMRTEQGRFTYTVDSIRVEDAASAEQIVPSTEPSITLITCFPFSYIGPAPRRWVARARLTAFTQSVSKTIP